MADINENIKRLQKMRAQQVKERRDVSLEYEKAPNPIKIIKKISAIQSRIDALDRAIADEENVPKEPSSWVGAV